MRRKSDRDSSLSGGTNRSEPDVGEDDTGISLLLLDICWDTRVSAASASGSTWISGVNRVRGIQPEHVGIVVIPERHHQDNSCINCLLDLTETTLLEEIGAVLRLCNPVFAEVIGDAVMLISIDSVAWMLDFLAILRVELFDLHELARICAIIGDELRGHGDWLGGINLEFSQDQRSSCCQGGKTGGRNRSCRTDP